MAVDVELHGSVAGYRAGCRGTAECVPSAMGTCAQAWVAYCGDFAIARMVDAGLSPAEVVEEERLRRLEASRARRPKVEAAPAPVASSTSRRAPVGVRGQKHPHGSPARYKAGCRTGCPASPSCSEAAADARAEDRAARRAEGVPAEMHGTQVGYTRGCQKGAPCPATPSCHAVHTANQRGYRAARARREAGRG